MAKTIKYIVGSTTYAIPDSKWGKSQIDCQCGYNRDVSCSAPTCKNVDRTVDYVIRGKHRLESEDKGA